MEKQCIVKVVDNIPQSGELFYSLDDAIDALIRMCAEHNAVYESKWFHFYCQENGQDVLYKIIPLNRD
jgi:hypothetical protein